MIPQYDFSVQYGETLRLHCTIKNPDSLVGIGNGSIVMKRNESTLPGKDSSPSYFGIHLCFVFFLKKKPYETCLTLLLT